MSNTIDLSHIAEPLRGLAVPIGSVIPDPANARRHDEKNLRAIQSSLRQFGQVKPIVVNAANNQIVAGNGTHAAALALGWTQIAATRVEMTPALQAALGVADNRTAELAAWDDGRLDDLLSAIKAETPDLFEDLALADLEQLVGQAEPEAAAPSEAHTCAVPYTDDDVPALCAFLGVTALPRGLGKRLAARIRALAEKGTETEGKRERRGKGKTEPDDKPQRTQRTRRGRS